MEAALSNDVDIAVALETLLPSKAAKWTSWAQILRDVGINNVGDVRTMSLEAWSALNLSPVLKSGVGLLREPSPGTSASLDATPTERKPSAAEPATTSSATLTSSVESSSLRSNSTATVAPASTSSSSDLTAPAAQTRTSSADAVSAETLAKLAELSAELAVSPLETRTTISADDAEGRKHAETSPVVGTSQTVPGHRGHASASSISLTDTMKHTATNKVILDHLKVARLPAVVALLHREAVHFSGMVNKINGSGRSQARAIIITEKAVYNCLEKTFVIKRRIPFESIAALTVSRGSGEFVIHVPFEYDYHYSGVHKEDVQVTLNWSFEQFAANFPNDIKDNQTRLVTNFTTDSKLADRVLTEDRSKILTKADREVRWVALQSPCLPSDHLHFSALPPIRRLTRELGDSNPRPEEVRFSAHVQKVNKKGLNQSRIFLVTDKAVYNLLQAKLDEYKCQRRIGLHEIAALTVSTQPQSTEFVLHLAKDYDYHFLSPNKTEITEVLVKEFLNYAAQHGSKFNMSQSALAVALKPEARLREYVLTKEMAAQMDEKLRQKRMRDIVLNATMAAAKAEAEAAAAAQKMAEVK